MVKARMMSYVLLNSDIGGFKR